MPQTTESIQGGQLSVKIPSPPLWLLGLLALFQLAPLGQLLAPPPPDNVCLQPTPQPSVSFEELLISIRQAERSQGDLTVEGIAQSNEVSSGQSCVAMAINYLTGSRLIDDDINGRYGFALLEALNSECRRAGYSWRDAGDFQASSWALIEAKLQREQTPVILALNGPDFSPNERGVIILLIGISGDRVSYIHPVDGMRHTATRAQIEAATPFPDGKFIFVAERL